MEIPEGLPPAPTLEPPAPTLEPPRPPRGATAALVAAVAAGAILLGAGSGAAAWGVLSATRGGPLHPVQAVTQATRSGTAPIQAQPPSGVAAGSLDLTRIAAQVTPVVVDINTRITTAGGSGSAAGTGIILTPDGEILTNNHVVEGSTSIEVTFNGRGGSRPARVLGVDPTADMALIKVDGVSGLPVAALAGSKGLAVGQPVAALGNALGRGGAPKVTGGRITALDQSITAGGSGTPEDLAGLIESDAQISPGDSGGPLVNSAGQVIGMTTAGQSSGRRSTVSQLGYAIPTDQLLPLVNQIRSGRASAEVIIGSPGYIGVTVTDLTPNIASRLGLDLSSGVAVTGVTAGSPAEGAGIVQGSVINSVGGLAVANSRALGSALHSHAPGDRVQIGWVDRAGTHSAAVTLTGGPAV